MSEPAPSRPAVARILSEIDRGDVAAAEQLVPIVYDELKGLARNLFRRQDRGHTLQPTALVHEVYLRLADQTRSDWRSRTHFFAVAARGMRQILLDQFRRRQADKRGGAWQRVTFSGGELIEEAAELDLLALHEAHEELAAEDPRESRIVELRFFGGLGVEEIAEVLQVSRSTVEADWRHARAWLRRKLQHHAS